MIKYERYILLKAVESIMLLVFDIGNTNIVLGLYDSSTLVHHWRIATDRQKTGDDYGMLIYSLFSYHGKNFKQIKGVIISSVVPPLTVPISRMITRYLDIEPLIVEPGIKTGINIKYENPQQVGADRIVNAVAAHDKYPGALIVIDFGTATTFDAITADGDYLGGAISPGIGISAEALFQKAAKLPRIELAKPPAVIARNTVASMQAGIIYGYVGLVDEITGRMKEELGSNPKVVATGGLANLIAEESKQIDVIEPFLTLEGLRIIYNIAQKTTRK